jgi:hypothetical protein
MCFPTVHLEAIRSRAARLALVERFLDIDISLDSFEEWGHGYPTVGRVGPFNSCLAAAVLFAAGATVALWLLVAWQWR